MMWWMENWCILDDFTFKLTYSMSKVYIYKRGSSFFMISNCHERIKNCQSLAQRWHLIITSLWIFISKVTTVPLLLLVSEHICQLFCHHPHEREWNDDPLSLDCIYICIYLKVVDVSLWVGWESLSSWWVTLSYQFMTEWQSKQSVSQMHLSVKEAQVVMTSDQRYEVSVTKLLMCFSRFNSSRSQTHHRRDPNSSVCRSVS